MSSNAIGYVTAAGSGSTVVYLTQTSGEFLAGEQISINGVTSTPRTIDEFVNYSAENIKSVQQTAVAPYLQNFSADLLLNPVALPGGVELININTSTITSGSSIPFSGIAVGDVISWNDIPSGGNDPIYARITAVAADARSFTIANMAASGGVDGVYNGTIGANANRVPAKLRVSEIWAKNDDGGLYEVLPDTNIASVDLSNSSLSISAQITGQSVVGSAATVSINDLNDFNSIF